jgi:hypothetical protein
MSILKRITCVAAVLIPAWAQTITSPAKPVQRRYVEPGTVSSSVRQIVAALGDRVQRAGKERVVMTGTLSRKGATSALRIVRETPGYLRIDETGGKNKSVAFDLTELKGKTAIDDDDEDLAEMLESDTAENFLLQFAPGSSVRKLGDRFRVKGETGFGSEVDVYEVVAPVLLKRNKQLAWKQYMFDSSTGLLRRVSYGAKVNGRAVLVQTVLSGYSQVAGYALPGLISRNVDGAVVFRFARESAAVTTAVEDGAFTTLQR